MYNRSHQLFNDDMKSSWWEIDVDGRLKADSWWRMPDDIKYCIHGIGYESMYGEGGNLNDDDMMRRETMKVMSIAWKAARVIAVSWWWRYCCDDYWYCYVMMMTVNAEIISVRYGWWLWRDDDDVRIDDTFVRCAGYYSDSVMTHLNDDDIDDDVFLYGRMIWYLFVEVMIFCWCIVHATASILETILEQYSDM